MHFNPCKSIIYSYYLYEGWLRIVELQSQQGAEIKVPYRFPKKHSMSKSTWLSPISNDGIDTFYIPMIGTIVKCWIPKKRFYIKVLLIPTYHEINLDIFNTAYQNLPIKAFSSVILRLRQLKLALKSCGNKMKNILKPTIRISCTCFIQTSSNGTKDNNIKLLNYGIPNKSHPKSQLPKTAQQHFHTFLLQSLNLIISSLSPHSPHLLPIFPCYR